MTPKTINDDSPDVVSISAYSTYASNVCDSTGLNASPRVSANLFPVPFDDPINEGRRNNPFMWVIRDIKYTGGDTVNGDVHLLHDGTIAAVRLEGDLAYVAINSVGNLVREAAGYINGFPRGRIPPLQLSDAA